MAGSLFAISPIPVKFGVKAGVNFPGEKISNTSEALSNFSFGNEFSYHVGVMARVNLGFIGVQPEILYSMDRFTNSTYGDMNMASVDFPVLANWSLIPSLLRINAGPVFHLSSKMAFKDRDAEVSMSRPAVGYAVGAAVSLWKLEVDFRYCGDFGKSTQDFVDGAGNTVSFDATHSGLMLSLGWMF